MTQTSKPKRVIATCARGHRIIETREDDLCPVCDANGELTEIVSREEGPMSATSNPKFQVIVGNIGTVYSGNNYMQAECKYSIYVKASKANYGRAAGEPVTLMHNGEIRSEYAGTLLDDEVGA